MDGQVMYSIVIPVYNEEEIIQVTYSRLTKIMEQTGQPYELIFVNDGSTDHTMDILTQAALIDSSVRVIEFSRRFGQQMALTAGLDAAKGQAIIVMNADLKDPPERIHNMIKLWNQGYDVVNAKRRERGNDTGRKREPAAVYNRILKGLTYNNIPVVPDDFRLIDRKVNEALKLFRAKNRTLRGLVSWAGFRQFELEYDQEEQNAGQTKYPLRKKIQLIVKSITSFSDKPLKMASYAGGFIFCMSFVSLLVTLCLPMFTNIKVAGWVWLLLVTLSLNGIMMMILGVMGAYMVRIYDEARDRPLYIVREKIGFDERGRSQPVEVDHTPKVENDGLSDALPSFSDTPSYHR